MFTPNEVLENSVNNKDTVSIKSALTSIIKYEDPTFNTEDFNKAVKYVESKGITIQEPYKLMAEEYEIAENASWTKKYFFYKTNMLEKNFAPAERIPHIKAVGKYVFGNVENPGRAPRKNRRSLKNTISAGQAIGMFAAIAAIAGVIIWIIKALR